MTIDKQKLKALTDRVKTDRRFCADEHHHALADGVLALLAEIEQLREAHEQVCTNYNRVSFASEERGKQIDQLKAENEALRKALGECADELSAEIICKHGGHHPDYMHPVTRRLFERDMAAVLAARAAMAKEASHD